MTINGQPWQAASHNTSLLPTVGNQPFWYAHHPSSWKLLQIGTGKKKKNVWIPQLTAIQLRAGVNGVRGQAPHLDTSLMRAQLANDGWTILDPAHHDYLRIYPCQGGGHLHLDKNIKLEVLAGHLIKDKSSVSGELEQWSLELVVSGQLRAPHEHFLRLLIQRQKKIIPRHLQNQHIPEVMEKLKAEKAILADMELALKQYKKDGLAVYNVGSSDE
jgi:hypothetical protein